MFNFDDGWGIFGSSLTDEQKEQLKPIVIQKAMRQGLCNGSGSEDSKWPW
jgi:hypothetical protein